MTNHSFQRLGAIKRSSLTPIEVWTGLEVRISFEACPDLDHRYSVPDPTNLHWHTYGVILKNNSDWLTLGNVLNNMYHIGKLLSHHKNAHSTLDPTNLHWHTFAVILKHIYDWLTLGNVLNNMYYRKKLLSCHKNAHSSLDTYANFVWKYDAARHAV